jgi:hypothetical protein
MIKATIKSTSMFVDRPKVTEILINENDVAMEPISESTGEKKRITVGQLFDLYKKGSVYYNDGSEPDEQLTPSTFEHWFQFKHLEGKPYSQRLISVEYQKIR